MRCAFVVCCKKCHQNIAAPVETMPSSWVAMKCPLCGEHRQHLPTQIFQGRVSYQAIKTPVRPATRSSDVRSQCSSSLKHSVVVIAEGLENTMTRRIDPKTFDLTYPCPACGYKIPSREFAARRWRKIRCPKCGAETAYQTHKPQTTS